MVNRLVVPCIILSTPHKNGCDNTFFQWLGTSPDHYDFSDIIDSGLVTTSACSFRTLGCIPLGSTNLCIFRFLRWPQASYSLAAPFLIRLLEECVMGSYQWRLWHKVVFLSLKRIILTPICWYITNHSCYMNCLFWSISLEAYVASM